MNRTNHKRSLATIAVAIIVLVSAGAVVGLSVQSSGGTSIVGGSIVGSPAVCWDGANVWYIAQGGASTTGNIYYKIGNGAWSAAIGSATNPTVVCQGAAGNVAIFVRGNDGNLYEKVTTDNGNTWSSWGAWPGKIASGTGPVAAFFEHSGTVTTAETVTQPYCTGPIGWCYPAGPGVLPTCCVPWYGPWPPPTPYPPIPPTPTTILQTDVFYVDSVSHHLMWNSQVSGVVGEKDLGGVATATPGAAMDSGGNPVVFVRGGDGGLYENMGSASGAFSGWTKFSSGVLAADIGPTAVSDGAGGIYVFVTGTNAQMYLAYSLNDGSTWSSWINLGGYLTSSPSGAYTSAYIVVAVRGGDGHIWTNTGSPPYTATSDWLWSTTGIA